MNNNRPAAVIWLLGATVYVVCEAVAASSFTSYSYVANYISDLGKTTVMNVGGFAVHGVLFLLGAVVVTRGTPLSTAGRGFVAAAAANAVGNVMIAVVPSHVDTTVPWHVLGAGLAILGGNIAIILGGRVLRRERVAHRRMSVALGSVGIGCLIAVVLGAQPAGLMERGAVYPIIAWELLTAAVLWRRCSR